MSHLEYEDPENVFLDVQDEAIISDPEPVIRRVGKLPNKPMWFLMQFADLVENSTCDGSIELL